MKDYLTAVAKRMLYAKNTKSYVEKLEAEAAQLAVEKLQASSALAESEAENCSDAA